MEAIKGYLLQTGSSRFSESQRLIEAACDDPETEPFKSKYKAREILHEIKCELSTLSETDSSEVPLFSFWIAALDCCLGTSFPC